MKIRKLQFKNINSLKGAHEIDFDKEPLKSAGLFAIIGPTGSGKTTILDAISLALYNNVPRLGVSKISNSIIEREGSIITRNMDEAYASVQYECAKGVYTSTWKISRARTGNLRNYEMEIADEKGDLLDVKSLNDYPEKNAELIGLSYDQFVKSMMLAQGEFNKLLRADKDERGALLEKITGSTIYRSLGMKAFDKVRSINNELKNIDAQIKSLKEKQLPEKDYLEKAERLNDLEKQLKELSKQIELLQGQKSIKEQVIDLKKRLKHNEENLENAQKGEVVFNEENSELLQQHEQAADLIEMVRNSERLEGQLLNKQERSQEVKDDLEQDDNKLQELFQKTAKFIQYPTEIDSSNLIKEVDKFENKVRDLIDQKRGLTVKFDTKHHALIESRESVSLDWPAISDENALTSLDSKNKELGTKLIQADEKLDPVFKGEDGMEQLNSVTLAMERYFNLKESIQFISLQEEKASAEIKNGKDRLEVIDNGLALKQKDAEILANKLSHKRKEKEYADLIAKYEEDRSKLGQGEPCPLCGSKEHPLVEDYSKKDSSDLSAEIAELSKAQRELDSQISVSRTEKQQLEKQLPQLESELKDLKKSLQNRTIELSEQTERLPDKLREMDKNDGQEILKTQKSSLEEYLRLTEILKALDQAAIKYKELAQIYQELKSLDSKIESLYIRDQLSNDMDGIRASFHKLTSNLENHAKRTKELEEEQKALQTQKNELESTLESKLKEKGYDNREAVKSAFMDPQDYKKLQKEKQELREEASKFKSSVEEIKSQLATKSENEVEQSLEELENSLTEKQTKFKEQSEIRDDLRLEVRMQEQHSKEIADLNKNGEALQSGSEKWILLNELIGDSEGKKFSNYAQELTLRQLVGLSNARLKDLSGRYSLDIPIQDDKEEDLMIIDHDLGGERRSVKTLSGGESFLVSLALALALSDLASRNVEIQSLFIDEGFGTLDPKSLDKVLDILEKLQLTSQKTVGVISHVASLKERISTKIEVKPNGQGYSTLEVIS